MIKAYGSSGGSDPQMLQAIKVIQSTYNHNVSIDAKRKNLDRYGRNPAATTSPSTVWEHAAAAAHETMLTANLIDTISSSNAGDTQLCTIEGHTISGSDLSFLIQTKALDGQNKVPLDTPMARAAVIMNAGSTDFAGDVYVYEDDTVTGGVPNTATKVHLKATAAQGDNESDKCAASISSQDYWILTQFHCAVLKKTAGFAEFSIQIKQPSGVYITYETFSASSTSGTLPIDFNPYIIVRPNSDVRVTCKADAANTDVMSELKGVLGKII